MHYSHPRAEKIVMSVHWIEFSVLTVAVLLSLKQFYIQMFCKYHIMDLSTIVPKNISMLFIIPSFVTGFIVYYYSNFFCAIRCHDCKFFMCERIQDKNLSYSEENHCIKLDMWITVLVYQVQAQYSIKQSNLIKLCFICFLYIKFIVFNLSFAQHIFHLTQRMRNWTIGKSL